MLDKLKTKISKETVTFDENDDQSNAPVPKFIHWIPKLTLCSEISIPIWTNNTYAISIIYECLGNSVQNRFYKIIERSCTLRSKQKLEEKIPYARSETLQTDLAVFSSSAQSHLENKRNIMFGSPTCL